MKTTQPLRRIKFNAVAFALASLTAMPAFAQASQSAIAAMQEPGPEMRSLAGRTGTWDATIRMRPSPDAQPIVFADLVAERQMIGAFLQEIISPRKPAPGADFKRIAYLHYNRVEGRWQYVSMDTRFPAGIMPAWSSQPSSADRITLEFEPIAFPGWGTAVDGWMLRSNYEVSGIGTDHETARQFWVRANGTGQRWLAVEYDYQRKAAGN